MLPVSHDLSNLLCWLQSANVNRDENLLLKINIHCGWQGKITIIDLNHTIDTDYNLILH